MLGSVNQFGCSFWSAAMPSPVPPGPAAGAGCGAVWANATVAGAIAETDMAIIRKRMICFSIEPIISGNFGEFQANFIAEINGEISDPTRVYFEEEIG